MFSSNDPDEQLVAACLARKPDALKELLERYSETIRAGITQALHSKGPPHIPTDPEDLYQDFCVELVGTPENFLGDFRSELGPLVSWLFTVANHFALNRLRSKQIRWPSHTVHLTLGKLDTLPDHSGEGLPDVDFITPLLDAMNGDLRVLIQAHFGLEPFDRSLNAVEIAQRVGCSASTVYRRLNYALTILRIHAETLQGQQD